MDAAGPQPWVPDLSGHCWSSQLRCGEILAWSCTGPYQKIFWRSLWSPLKRSLYDLVQVLVRRSCGDPGQVLSKKSLHENLARHVLQVVLWKLSWEALGRFLYQDFVRSAPAAAGPFMTILWASFQGAGMQILVKVFYTSLWEDLVGMLVTCCRRPLDDLVQVRVRSSWRGPGEIF